ncbi:unnamed protein product, partial [Ilex paraguariensis]
GIFYSSEEMIGYGEPNLRRGLKWFKKSPQVTIHPNFVRKGVRCERHVAGTAFKGCLNTIRLFRD